MNYSKNKSTPQGTRIHRGEVTSRYRSDPRIFHAGLNEFSS
jgi:hypothetical protein